MADYIVLVDGLRILLDNSTNILSINSNVTRVNVNNEDLHMKLTDGDITANINTNELGLIVPNDNINIELRCGSTLIPKEELMQKIAGANIGNFRCVVANSAGHILHADSALVLAGKDIIGVSAMSSAIGGLCDIAITNDEIIEPSWNWDTNRSIYATEYGHLTQVIPTENYLQMIAIPLSPTSIRIRIEPPIFI